MLIQRHQPSIADGQGSPNTATLHSSLNRGLSMATMIARSRCALYLPMLALGLTTGGLSQGMTESEALRLLRNSMTESEALRLLRNSPYSRQGRGRGCASWLKAVQDSPKPCIERDA